MGITNPNGANQYQLDPRQKLCWDLYINPKSETFGNAYQSALKAGYEEATCTTITTTDWFIEKRRRINMLEKAEKVLEEMLEMPVESLEVTGKGEEVEQIIVTNPSLVKIKQDTAKFVAERQGKDKGWSLRTELTGADGKEIGIKILEDSLKTIANEPRIDENAETGQDALQGHGGEPDKHNGRTGGDIPLDIQEALQ